MIKDPSGSKPVLGARGILLRVIFLRCRHLDGKQHHPQHANGKRQVCATKHRLVAAADSQHLCDCDFLAENSVTLIVRSRSLLWRSCASANVDFQVGIICLGARRSLSGLGVHSPVAGTLSRGQDPAASSVAACGGFYRTRLSFW